MLSVLKSIWRFIAPAHLPFREWGFFPKLVQINGWMVALHFLIGGYLAFAAAVSLAFLISAYCEYDYRKRIEWRTILSVLGAVAAFVYVYQAGDQMFVPESIPEKQEPTEFYLASFRAAICVLLWLLWDGIIAPRDPTTT